MDLTKNIIDFHVNKKCETLAILGKVKDLINQTSLYHAIILYYITWYIVWKCGETAVKQDLLDNVKNSKQIFAPQHSEVVPNKTKWPMTWEKFLLSKNNTLNN